MDVLTAVFAITLPIIVTIVLTNRQTQCILRKLERLQRRMYEDHCCMLEKIHCLLRKVDLGLRANALMHGWERADDVSPEEAARLPEPKVYDAELGVCYYKPA
jgi:hypothetical protein